MLLLDISILEISNLEMKAANGVVETVTGLILPFHLHTYINSFAKIYGNNVLCRECRMLGRANTKIPYFSALPVAFLY